MQQSKLSEKDVAEIREKLAAEFSTEVFRPGAGRVLPFEPFGWPIIFSSASALPSSDRS
jgi:hypothetical protein